MKKKLIVTADGSHSFYLEEMDEHYHSKHGSVAESKHIFIGAGLKPFLQTTQKLNILEIGMGTGLNVWLTALALKGSSTKAFYTAVEAYPLTLSEIENINYPDLLGKGRELFNQIHQTAWETPHQLSDELVLLKRKAKLQEIQFEQQYELVYFDAFAPEKQAELWEEAMFRKLYQAMKVGGVLVTYCVKGVIRRRLKVIGFEVEKLAGPPGGKREMLRARKV